MGKQRQPRQNWSEKMDKLEGIRRDKTTGIVLARENRHPLADWFRCVPMGTGMPGMRFGAEIEHLLGIHVFDNLQLPAPKAPLYTPRRDRDAPEQVGMEMVIWVPRGAPEEALTDPIAEKEVTVHDVRSYTDEQLAAMGAQVRQLQTERKMVAQTDTGGAT